MAVTPGLYFWLNSAKQDGSYLLNLALFKCRLQVQFSSKEISEFRLYPDLSFLVSSN
jgi:hypothetical protein